MGGPGRAAVLIVAAVVIASGAAAAAARSRGQEARLSPHESNHATIDGAHITITYGRPFMRGRKIFGGLVPFDRIWMPGADEATILQTDRALDFGHLHVPAGSYSLYTLPAARQWQLIINRQTGQWHTEYDQSQDLGRIPMRIEPLSPPVEQLLIQAVPHDSGGALELRWERTLVYAPFSVEPGAGGR
ncbi:MAG: DUF2911 domain-containing protein [Acidobacteriota bacterium]|nr:DUF2911 domain-containing protein [Acidobacteriota bacterium]